jgi:hypothetical protein
MKKNKLFLFALSAFVFLAPYTYSAQNNIVLTADKIDPSHFYNTAIVQGLNKTTAKTSILEIKIGEKTRFGKIDIIAHRCWQAPLDQNPETKILLEIFEEKNEITNPEEKTETQITKTKEVRIFYGWIFASTPSISGIEHPIYDLTALGCKNIK